MKSYMELWCYNLKLLHAIFIADTNFEIENKYFKYVQV